jgi:hypothetical protein
MPCEFYHKLVKLREFFFIAHLQLAGCLPIMEFIEIILPKNNLEEFIENSGETILKLSLLAIFCQQTEFNTLPSCSIWSMQLDSLGSENLTY